MGPPGAGKGTIANRLKDDFEYKLVAAGDLLRAEKDSGSELGKKIASIIDGGNLVPDNIIDSIIYKEIKTPMRITESFLIDGYPRSASQATMLEQMINVPIVIWINISDKTTIKRNLKRGLTSGRADDSTEEIIKTRIENYKLTCEPIKKWYGNRLIEIDGEGTIDEVYKRVVDTLFETVKEPKEISEIK